MIPSPLWKNPKKYLRHTKKNAICKDVKYVEIPVRNRTLHLGFHLNMISEICLIKELEMLMHRKMTSEKIYV